jgi:hypothetical protein
MPPPLRYRSVKLPFRPEPPQWPTLLGTAAASSLAILFVARNFFPAENGSWKITKCTVRRRPNHLLPMILSSRFDIDVIEKKSGERMQASEVGIYKVKDGKVICEEFLPMS